MRMKSSILMIVGLMLFGLLLFAYANSTAAATAAQASGCVIPESGPWPPCATGGNTTPSTGECVIPPSGPWPPCATGGASTPPASGGDCVIPPSGPWPPCATGEGAVSPITQPAFNPTNISYRQRFGVSGGPEDANTARNLGMNFGSFISWGYTSPQALPSQTTPWQMVRVSANGVRGGTSALEKLVTENLGSVWVIGNEPDVQVQDNVTPARYAEIYWDAYRVIKSADASAYVAIAGVSSPTPLRLQYLGMILDAYQQKYGEPMPIDVWTVHVYVLREQRNSWGIGIPTGMDWVNDGMLYEIEDHNDFNIANQMVVDLRAFLAQRGYQDTPLAITEFGILLPADFGFTPDVVSEYMRQTIGFYLNQSDPATGYPVDSNRLVQQWFWFSLFDGSEEFSVGNLIDRNTGKLTPIGVVYSDYVR